MKAMFCVVIAGGTAPAFGQAFNIDVAGFYSTTHPSDMYGGAAGQAGYWNPVALQTGLRDLAGNPTGVIFGSGGSGGRVIEIPGATGDDKALMESMTDVSQSSAAAVVINLTPGAYDVFVYCWYGSLTGAHSVAFNITNDQTTVFGGVAFEAQWPGQQVLGETYDRLRVEVLATSGAFVLNMRELGGGAEGGSSLLSGLQVVPVPAPGAIPALLSFTLLAARRRR